VCRREFAKNHGLKIVLQEFLADAGSFIDVAASNAKGAIDHRRVVKDKGFFRGGCAIGGLHFDLRFNQARSEFAGICNGGGAADELGFATVEPRDASQAAKDIAQVASKDAAVSVEFVDNDVFQIFEQAGPARVLRKNSGVQHVRVGQDDVRFFADRLSRVAGRVAVIGKDPEGILEALVQVVKFGELILCESFGGEEVEGACVGAREDGVEDREVVAESFARSSRGDDNEILSGVDCLGGSSLMRVEPSNALGAVGVTQIGMRPVGKIRPLRFTGGIVADGGKDFAVMVARGKGVKNFRDAGE